MVKFVESELADLREEVNEMWTLVYNQLSLAGEAVLTFDRELAQQVIVREKRVNAYELKIDCEAEGVIARYNLVATNLRFVLAMLKINSNLERLGDISEGIARFVVHCDKEKLDKKLLQELRLKEMVQQLLCMFETARQALNEEKVERAVSVFGKDSLVDEINADVSTVLARYIETHKGDICTCLDLACVFRKLERSGDHITNLAEEIVFYIDAEVLKHQSRTGKNKISEEKKEKE